MKKPILIILCVLLMLINAVASAAGISDSGSIQITLTDGDGAAVKKADIRIYRIADAASVDSQLTFSWTDSFTGCGVPITDLFKNGTADKLAKYVTSATPVPLTECETDNSGSATAQVKSGAFLIIQSSAADNKYNYITPFIVSVPMMNGKGTGWVYDIQTYPKVELRPQPTATATTAPSSSGSSSGSLPQTGVLQWTRLALAICGVVLLMIGAALFFSRKVHMSFSYLGMLMVVAGTAALTACGILLAEDTAAEQEAGRHAQQVMAQIRETVEEASQTAKPYTTAEATETAPVTGEDSLTKAGIETVTAAAKTVDVPAVMSTVTIEGREYIGWLEMPTIDIDLAVLSSWSYPNLRISPCLYSGSDPENMVLLAHNYDRHFGRIKELKAGDPVQFVSADGRIYKYVVAKTEVIAPRDVEKMVTGPYNLTLFTCTNGGTARLAVRLTKVLNYSAEKSTV